MPGRPAANNDDVGFHLRTLNTSRGLRKVSIEIIYRLINTDDTDRKLLTTDEHEIIRIFETALSDQCSSMSHQW